MTRSNQKTSQRRWEAGHHLQDRVVPSLPQSSHVQVLMTCWFYACTTEDNQQKFDLTKTQIAEATKLSHRTVQRCLSEMEEAGVIKTIKLGAGNRGSIRHITGHAFRRGDMVTPPDQQSGDTVSDRGDTVSNRGDTEGTLSETEQTNGVVSLEQTPPTSLGKALGEGLSNSDQNGQGKNSIPTAFLSTK